jgi:hypothetical protein
MAAGTERIGSIIEQARLRRIDLSHYLRLDGARVLLALFTAFCLLSLIVLVQTSMVAARGYELAALRAERISLTRDHSKLREELARAQALPRVRERAAELGFQPLAAEQMRYIRLPELIADQPAGR